MTINVDSQYSCDCNQLLLVLAEALLDEDNATFAARLGAHPLLLRLMEHESESIQEVKPAFLYRLFPCVGCGLSRDDRAFGYTGGRPSRGQLHYQRSWHRLPI